MTSSNVLLGIASVDTKEFSMKVTKRKRSLSWFLQRQNDTSHITTLNLHSGTNQSVYVKTERIAVAMNTQTSNHGKVHKRTTAVVCRKLCESLLKFPKEDDWDQQSYRQHS